MGRGGAKRFKPGGYDSSCAPAPSPLPPPPRPPPPPPPPPPPLAAPSPRHRLERALGPQRTVAAAAADGVAHRGRGRYSTDGAMRDSNSQFSVSFYAKFFSCVICSLFIVGMAFSVMNSWLGVSGPPPPRAPPLARHACCL